MWSKILRTSLAPLAWSWEMVYRLRRSLYNAGLFPSASLDVPVISVGNLTFGGTGKTPLTLWLARQYERQGWRPVILTRGYQGQSERGAVALEAQDRFRFNPIIHGDEPVLMAKKLKKGGVIVGRKRAANYQRLSSQLSPHLAILDDGLQHLQIQRQVNLVLFDALAPLRSYQLAPRGYLREGPSALQDVDAVILNRVDQVSSAKLTELWAFLSPYLAQNTVRVHMRYRPVGIFNCAYERVQDPEELRGAPVVAVAAVGAPESFFRQLESLGASIVRRFIYSDHYQYQRSDIDEFLSIARQKKAWVLMSEKDVVKVRQVSHAPELRFLEVEVELTKGRSQLISLLNQKMRPLSLSP